DLATINEDDFSNGGTLVSDLISGQITDADSGSVEGIAVVAVDDSHGTWEYSTDGGSNWTAFGAVDSNAARLLATDANTSVRFVPDAGWTGAVTDGITFHAWDQTSGTAGGTADLTSTSSSVIADEDWNPANYSGGTGNWVGNWTEVGDDGNSATGNIVLMTAGQVGSDPIPYLKMALSGTRSIERGVDLSGLTSATVSF
ncbi:MAG: hypothetical protein KDI74_18955, partial [Gammaproteobacteria bacterium]|nr:hypothetical protein [Gammaproteobacteria bacterium]